ncbi:MAG: serine hydrolase domain-containing protein [Spirochaetota bacterium]|nr:serine hydrolase domain-containing protein [Spirochaetota bacterium]
MKINSEKRKDSIKQKEILFSGFLFYIGIAFLLSFSCLMFSCCSSGEQVGGSYRGIARKIDKMFTQIRKIDNFSGCVQVRHNNLIIFNKSYGYSNREFGIPNIPETRFMVGSITKQMTAAAILLLEERGKLSLDDKMNRYFPYLSGASSVSVRELLSHCGGIPREYIESNLISEIPKMSVEPWFDVAPEFQIGMYRYYYNKDSSFIMRRNKFSNRQLQDLQYTFHCLGFDNDLSLSSVNEGVERLLKREKNFGKAAHKFNYSNYGYMILGALIEKCSGMKYEDFLCENFFNPLDMSESGFGYSKNLTPLLSQGYYEYDDKNFFNPLEQDGVVNMPDYVNTYNWPGSAGMAYSTTTDLIKWQCGLKNVLSSDSIAKMFRGSNIIRTGSSSRYGLGTYVSLVEVDKVKKKMFWHDGVIYNFNSIMASFPRDDLQIVILSNQMSGNGFYNWPKEIAEIVFSRYAGFNEDEEFLDEIK